MATLLRPRWLLSHVLVVVLVVVLVNLGFWQLRRLDERRDRNRLVAERTAEPVVPVRELLSPDDGRQGAEAVQYRRAEARGVYAPDDEVLVRSRSLDGRPGSWVLTPLITGDGTAVVVNRGWVPVSGTGDRRPAAAAAPDGTVTVTGLLLPSQERGRFGPTDPQGSHLATLARADLGRLQEQVDYDLVPAYLQLADQQPPVDGDLPVPLDPPESDDGPHLGYAVQWFVFATIAVVGYPLILRRAV